MTKTKTKLDDLVERKILDATPTRAHARGRGGSGRREPLRPSTIGGSGHESGEEPYADFMLSVGEAEAQFVVDALATIRNAGPKSWIACAWLLERRCPEWRSPEVKLKEKLAKAALRQPSADHATTDRKEWTLAEIVRELAIRRQLVQIIEATPEVERDARDAKLLEDYSEAEEPAGGSHRVAKTGAPHR